ncbi:MAG: hypothetical protein ACRD8O_11675 [Bryobacteraceae bacterium]
MVIALAGRRIDAPDQPGRFPAKNEAVVAERIRRFIGEHQPLALVSSAACGADILALEAAAALGIRRRVILPFAREEFRKTSVTDRPGDWGERYDRLLDEIERHQDMIAAGHSKDEKGVYVRTNEAILDEAIALARESAVKAAAVIVWNGESRGAEDVTAAFADQARARGMEVFSIPTL